jgi:hypothetical protein
LLRTVVDAADQSRGRLIKMHFALRIVTGTTHPHEYGDLRSYTSGCGVKLTGCRLRVLHHLGEGAFDIPPRNVVWQVRDNLPLISLLFGSTH